MGPRVPNFPRTKLGKGCTLKIVHPLPRRNAHTAPLMSCSRDMQRKIGREKSPGPLKTHSLRGPHAKCETPRPHPACQHREATHRPSSRQPNFSNRKLVSRPSGYVSYVVHVPDRAPRSKHPPIGPLPRHQHHHRHSLDIIPPSSCAIPIISLLRNCRLVT